MFCQILLMYNLTKVSNDNLTTIFDENSPQTSETDYYSDEWIKFGNFSTGAASWWDSEKDGDLSDVDSSISGDAANYIVKGNTFEKQFDDPIDTTTASNWLAFNKTEPAMNPDKYTTDETPNLRGDYFIDDDGFFMNHTWHDDTPDQFVSISWRYNASMGVDMSDYTITNASFDAIMNATVNWNVDTQYCTDARSGYSINQGGIFDHAFFTVEVATMDLSSIYEIAYNQTSDLGRDDISQYTIEDKSIENVGEEQDLIYYLTSLLDRDPGHDEFAIIVTMEIRCEDDQTGTDWDDWEELRIKSLNLTLTYEKNIDKLTTLSWYQDQDGEKIPSNYDIENATLNFQYKIDKDWATNTGSINSEFRIIINDNQLGETVKLNTASTSYQEIKSGGFDVTSFLSADQYVNLSIQIYIGDNFILDSDITISIDNVSLIIGYGIYTEPDNTAYNLFLNDVNRTTEKSTEVTYSENLNVTFIYKNSTGDFISGADVEISGDGLPSTPLDPDLGHEQYYKIINTTDLGVGTTYLTLTASKKYHTTQEFQITVNVISRDSELQLFLENVNETLDKETTLPWSENLNITIKYMDLDNTPKTHISDATVELTGAGATRTLDEDEGNEQYEYSLNSSILGEGSTFLTVYASKDNYTSLNVRFKVIVSTRTTYLDNIELNGIETDTITIEWNEIFEVSVAYNDTDTDNAILGATVQLIGEDYLKPLVRDGNLYKLTVNTFDLPIKPNILTLFAQKDNYSIASEIITVNVNERATTIETILNHTSTSAISYPYGELLNITAIYNDHSGPFINGAIVQLREGANPLHTLEKTGGINQYSYILNTSELSIGSNSLTIYAKQDNYTAQFASITLTINNRTTTLEIYLDGFPTTVADKHYDESLNITVVYKDFTGAFIDGATCELWSGEEFLYTLYEDLSYPQYERIINTKYLELKTNALAIYASKDNYTALLVSITVVVREKETSMDIILDNNPGTTVEVIYSELVNITAIYKDKTPTFIAGATVELRKGTSVLETLDEFSSHYSVLINSNRLDLGGNILSVYAEKTNYSVLLVTILINVNERDTTLDVSLDGINSDTFEFFNISISDSVDIVAVYDDFEDNFLSGATVELTGTGISELLTPGVENYTYTLDALSLGVGVHFLVISASLENYSVALKNIKLNVLERNSTLKLLIDDVDITIEQYVATEINKFLNITVFFTDPAVSGHISNADIRLTGALEANFTETAPLQQYNITLDTDKLQQGINFLTIFAQKDNYLSRSLIFTIEVKQKNSSLQVILNDIFNPIDNSIKVTVGELVNITVIYGDNEMNFIDNASIIIVGEGLNQTSLIKHPTYNQYSVSINTLDLNFGINLLTLYAQKANYQPQTLIIRIEINEKETDMEIYLNGILQSKQDRSINLPIKALLNITVKYYDNETGDYIPGSDIQLVGESLTDYYLTEYASLEQYAISLDTTLLDIGVRFLTIYATHVNFQSYTALLRIQVDRIQTNITTMSGEIVYNRQPGDNFILEVQLKDEDFNVNVLNATVSYTWAYGQGTLTDPDNDGIYTTTLSDLPEGTFPITITVYAGDDYDFERYIVTLNVIRPPEDVLLFQILTIAGIAAAVGISGYLIAYQRVLKYPKEVRKIRKFKSKLKKSKSLGIETLSRDEIIDKNYAEKIRPLEKQIKSKITPKSTETEIKKDKIEPSENLNSQ